MKILIDADYIVYKACAAAETEIDWGDDVIVVSSRFSDAYRLVQHEITKIKNAFFTADACILFFSSSSNFRKFILPDYKGHRNRKKPCGYRRVIAALEKEYEVIRMDGLEADDALGIYATLHEGNCIVSPDKDMRQIPGQLYNLDSFTLISPEQGEAWHLIQTIAGDQTDGYAGVPAWADDSGCLQAGAGSSRSGFGSCRSKERTHSHGQASLARRAHMAGALG